MQFQVKTCYNFDALNLLNTLSADEFYTQFHTAAFERFQPQLSQDARKRLSRLGEARGNHMFGPEMCLLLSALPDAEEGHLAALLADTERIQSHFKDTPYYSDENWPKNLDTLETLSPVVLELEQLGLKAYWQAVESEAIQGKVAEIRDFARHYDLAAEIEGLLGPGHGPQEITVYIGAYARPHGIKIVGPRYISDVKFNKETTLAIAIHEMFHPPYQHTEMEEELQALMDDEFFRQAFETQDPKFGYTSPQGFMEENVVEAMGIYIAHKLGLKDAPLRYFAEHDQGSHVLSVLLFDAFQTQAKPEDQDFPNYLKGLLASLPTGNLRSAYMAIMDELAPERFQA